jgi:hypothetical protein
MKEIPLSNSTNVALVDDHHYGWLSQYSWRELKTRWGRTTYAARVSRTPDGRKVTLLMHREILGLDVGDPREADHQDGNGLNNLESNLRVVTPLQNAANRPLEHGSRTGHKGVCPDRHGLFRAVIRVHGIQTRLGLYADVLEASFCYNTAAAHLYGEHARLNPIPPDHIPPERQAQLRQEVLTVLAERAEKPLTTRSPGQVSWDASRSRWRVKAVITDHWVYIGSYHDKAEADYAAALALNPNAVPDATIKPASLEFIRKRVAYLHSVHQPEPEPAGI